MAGSLSKIPLASVKVLGPKQLAQGWELKGLGAQFQILVLPLTNDVILG